MICGTLQGSVDEKLRWVFKICDKNRDGSISQDEAAAIIAVSIQYYKVQH